MGRRKKRIFIGTGAVIIVAAALGVLLLRSSVGRLPRKPYVIAVFKSNCNSMDFWIVLRDGLKTAAKEFGARLSIRGPNSETDIDGEIRIFRGAIRDKPDAIVLAAADYNRLVPACRQAVRAGIRLVTVDSGVNSNVAASLISTNNVLAGKHEGTFLASILPPRSKIAIVSHVKNSATAIEREKGVRLGIAQAEGDTIVKTVYSNSDRAQGCRVTKALLRSHPEIRGIAALNESSASGAADALSELGLAGKVKLVGFDSSIAEIQYIEKGTIRATFVQEPFNMGYLSLRTALYCIEGRSVPRRIDTEAKLITRKNMYEAENEKLLFPFSSN